jgi:hypothetical protein
MISNEDGDIMQIMGVFYSDGVAIFHFLLMKAAVMRATMAVMSIPMREKRIVAAG